MSERRLEINVAKSACLRVGRAREGQVQMIIRKGDEEQVLEEVKMYKYQGVRLGGKNRVFWCQQANVIKEVKWRVAALKAKGQEVPDIVSGGDMMWN